MHPLRILVVVISIAFLIQLASATTYLNIYLDERGNALFLGQTDAQPSLPVGVTLSNGKITGTTSTLTSKTLDVWSFSYSSPGAEINVVLPDSSTIKSLSGGDVYIEKGNLQVYARDNISVTYTLENTQTSQSSNVLLILLIAIGAAVMVLIVFLIIFRRNRVQKKNVLREPIPVHAHHSIRQMLHERQVQILDKLGETGKVKMSYLRKLLEMPKASFTRHVQELEKKGLVARSGEGRNKFVELKEKMMR